MYSGTTLYNKSGNLLGAHQKFDRVARRFVVALRPEARFPETKAILGFEGNNGPDGIKRKSPGVDEPWHYWDPSNPEDHLLLDIIDEHHKKLVVSLRANDMESAAFESAWMAHAIVDGLTPAHHYPYEEKLTELRGGESKETRTSIRNKLVIQGNTKREMISRNWKMWGTKGLLLSHGGFEFGVSYTVKALKLRDALPTNPDIRHARNITYRGYLKHAAKEIYDLNMYERFLRRGWSMKLAREVKTVLAPAIVRAIAIAWVLAYDESQSEAK